MKEKFKAHLEYAEKTISGNIARQEPLSSQERKVILLKDFRVNGAKQEELCDEHAVCLHQNNTVISLDYLRRKYERAFKHVSRAEHLPPERNPCEFETFREHFGKRISDKNLNQHFWYLVERLYEIREYGRLAAESGRVNQDDFVDTWVQHNIDYYAKLKHFHLTRKPLDLNRAIVSYFRTIERDKPYSGLAVSDLDQAGTDGSSLMSLVGQFFWNYLSLSGYNKRDLILRDQRELSEIARKGAEHFSRLGNERKTS